MFHMPDSYYDPPDYDYTPLQEAYIEAGQWDPDLMEWDDFVADFLADEGWEE